MLWQWLLLLSLTLDKTKTINKFSKLHPLFLTKRQVTEIIYNISTSALLLLKLNLNVLKSIILNIHENVVEIKQNTLGFFLLS